MHSYRGNAVNTKRIPRDDPKPKPISEMSYDELASDIIFNLRCIRTLLTQTPTKRPLTPEERDLRDRFIKANEEFEHAIARRMTN